MVEKCIQKIRWEKESDRSLMGKLERLFHRLKRDGGDGQFFWQQICENNAYAAVCLLSVLSAQYGKADPDVQAGKQQVQEYLTALTRHNASTVLALLMNADFETVKRIYEQDYIHVDSAKEIVDRLDGMCTEQQLGTILCNWLGASLYGSSSHQYGVYKAIVLKFRLGGRSFQKDPALVSYCQTIYASGDLLKMMGIITVFGEIDLPEVTGRDLEDFRQIALDNPSPLGCYVYEMLLSRSGLSDEEQEKQLRTFTVRFGFRGVEHIWSDFYLFSYLVKKKPHKFPDYRKEFSYLIQYEKDVCSPMSRRQHHELVEEPFRALVSIRSLYLPEFMRLIKPCSLFVYSEEKPYAKSKTWIDDGGMQSIALYIKYMKYILEDYSVTEAVEIYMNSPMKAYIDFYSFIRIIWKKMQEQGMPSGRIKSLLDGYWFRGRLEKTQTESYKVSVSSVSSTYKFPVLFKWGAKHTDRLEMLCQKGQPVFFKIHGINPKNDMIFAYEVQEQIAESEV